MSLEDGTTEKSTSNAEVESAETGGDTPAPLTPLSRKLKNRHVAMIRYVVRIQFLVNACINEFLALVALLVPDCFLELAPP